MLEQAKKKITGIARSSHRIGVAVSGGSDSMCLLHLVFSLGYKTVAVNIDHSTRNGASAEDSRFVADYCKANNIQLSAHTVDAPKEAAVTRRNLEAVARQLRYGIFDKVVKEGPADVILTAHHAADQAETVLLRALRGCGGGGLAGILDDPARKIYRPLLTTPKAQISEYLTKHNIPYITDQSNFDTSFDRNFLRHKILPLLEERFCGCTERLANLAAAQAFDEDYISSSLQTVGAAIGRPFIGSSIPLTSFDGHPALVPRYILKALDGADISRANIEDIIKLAKNGANGDRVSLPDNITAWREYDNIVFAREASRLRSGQAPQSAVKKFPSLERRRAKRTHSRLRHGAAVGGGVFWTIVPVKKIPTMQAGRYFDINAVPKNAVIRTRKEGDVLHKFDGTTVKLKEYLIDKKVPSRLRDTIPLICDGSNVLFVSGYEVSKQLAVKEGSNIGEIINNANI